MNKREDMSDFLFHFIKGSNAYETLSQILIDGVIKDIQNKGYICFTETPLLFFKPLLDYFQEHFPYKPMYSQYGIGVSKQKFFEIGGRTVVYGYQKKRIY